MKQSPKMPAEKRKAQLIRAAERLFRKKGYNGTSVDQIAKAARLTKGAVYFHFDSKKDLFFEVIRDYWTTKVNPLYEILDRETDSIIILDKTIEFAFELIRSGEYFSIPFWQQALKIPSVKNYWMEEYQKIIGALVISIANGTRLTIDESQALVRILSAVLDGMIVQHQMCRDVIDLDVQQRELMKIVNTYLKG